MEEGKGEGEGVGKGVKKETRDRFMRRDGRVDLGNINKEAEASETQTRYFTDVKWLRGRLICCRKAKETDIGRERWIGRWTYIEISRWLDSYP